MSEPVEAPTVSRTVQLARALRGIKDQQDELKAELNKLGEDREMIEADLLKALEADGIDSLRVEGVGLIYLQSDTYARIAEGKKEQVLAWLDGQGLGDLAPRAINAKTFAAQYREWEATDKPLPPAELVGIYREPSVRLKKS